MVSIDSGDSIQEALWILHTPGKLLFISWPPCSDLRPFIHLRLDLVYNIRDWIESPTCARYFNRQHSNVTVPSIREHHWVSSTGFLRQINRLFHVCLHLLHFCFHCGIGLHCLPGIDKNEFLFNIFCRKRKWSCASWNSIGDGIQLNGLDVFIRIGRVDRFQPMMGRYVTKRIFYPKFRKRSQWKTWLKSNAISKNHPPGVNKRERHLWIGDRE
jgi:hypothetical protein